MDLVGMQIFVRVVEAKSFSAAARRMKLSKSVVSKHVSRLERSMGVRLLNRTTRSISLTEIGRAFYERCAEVIAAAEQAELTATRFQSEPRGTLLVAAPVSFGMLHLASALPGLLASCPELGVELTLTNRQVNVIEEGFDAAIVVATDLQPGLVARRIATVARHLCASPDYLARRGTPATPASLRDHDCLVFTAPTWEKRWGLRTAEGEVYVPVEGRLGINNLNALRHAAIAGAGIALLPAYLVADDLARGTLVAVMPHAPPIPSTLHVVFPPSRHLSPKVRAFVDFLVEQFSALDAARDHAEAPETEPVLLRTA